MESTLSNRLRFVALLGVALVSLMVGTVSAQARSNDPYSAGSMPCSVQHLGAAQFCTAVENRKAIKILRKRELREAHRVHVKLRLSHRLSWKLDRLRRANRWHRHNLRTLQSMPTWMPTQPLPLGRMLAYQAGWTDSNGEWPCLYNLWNRESGWSTPDFNGSSGAGGIPQALPPSKMGSGWDETDASGQATLRALEIQIRWGIGYIKARYGDACSAWAHSNAYNFY